MSSQESIKKKFMKPIKSSKQPTSNSHQRTQNGKQPISNFKQHISNSLEPNNDSKILHFYLRRFCTKKEILLFLFSTVMAAHSLFHQIRKLKTAYWAKKVRSQFTQKSLAASQKIFFLSLVLGLKRFSLGLLGSPWVA